MKKAQDTGKDYIYSTEVTTNTDSSSDEFVVEVFEYSPNLTCEGEPRKLIKNFDELIKFIESID